MLLYLQNDRFKKNSFFGDYIRKNLFIRSSNLKKKDIKETITYKLTGLFNLELNQTDELYSFFQTLNLNFCHCKFYERIYFNNITYNTCNNKSTKFANDLISFNNQVGIINYIICQGDCVYIICKKLSFISQPFCNNAYRDIKSSFAYYNETRSFFSIKHTDLVKTTKHFYYEFSNSFYMVNNFTSNHIFC
jgi:hypothetical protein